ncbi:hypothetical protein KP509_02G055600, partial [Ceratopteris richardii]
TIFESRHGKGEHDNVGVVIKMAFTHEQLKHDGATLKCVVDVVAYLRQHLSIGAFIAYTSQVRNVSSVFWEVCINDVNREDAWDFEGSWKRSRNGEHVKSSNYHALLEIVDDDVEAHMSIDTFTFEDSDDYLCDALMVYDNYVVNIKEGNLGVYLFMLTCTQEKHEETNTLCDG